MAQLSYITTMILKNSKTESEQQKMGKKKKKKNERNIVEYMYLTSKGKDACRQITK